MCLCLSSVSMYLCAECILSFGLQLKRKKLPICQARARLLLHVLLALHVRVHLYMMCGVLCYRLNMWLRIRSHAYTSLLLQGSFSALFYHQMKKCVFNSILKLKFIMFIILVLSRMCGGKSFENQTKNIQHRVSFSSLKFCAWYA